MTRHAELDCSRHGLLHVDPLPLSHVLTCDECADRICEQAREFNPEIRTDLFPGDECPGDDALVDLARERGSGPAREHLRHCLWCALSVRHFDLVPESRPPVASQASPAFLERMTPRGARPLPPSAQIDYQGDSLSIRSPLDQRVIRFLLNPKHSVRRLIPLLVTRQQLPVTAPDGTPMNYSLEWKEGDRRLDERETLREAGVKKGDHLILVPEIAIPIPKG